MTLRKLFRKRNFTIVILEKLKACGFEEKQLLYNKSNNCCFCRDLKEKCSSLYPLPFPEDGVFAFDFQSISDFFQPLQSQIIRRV